MDMDKNSVMDNKAGIFMTIAVVGIIMLIIVWIVSGTVAQKAVEKSVAQEPIRTYVTNRMCQFVSPPTQGQGMWAACNDGSSWAVVPLKAGQSQP